MRILHIEDDIRIYNSLKKLLKYTGNDWPVKYASSVLEALTALCSDSYDIVLIDYRLDRIFSGNKITDTLRVLKIPYIYYTAETERRIRCIDKNGKYLSKLTPTMEIPKIIKKYYEESQVGLISDMEGSNG